MLSMQLQHMIKRKLITCECQPSVQQVETNKRRKAYEPPEHTGRYVIAGW